MPSIASSPDHTVIDLRSDTLTKPTTEMRAAMASAEVGDDVYGEDPTVNLLEARAAEVFGREAGLFVPTGTMGNQVAIRLHTRPGQEILCESRAHILDWEMGMAAAFSGAQIRTVVAPRGILSWELLAPFVYTRSTFRSATALIEIENTHNMAGGVCTPLPELEEIWHEAKKRNLPVHLDGARVFNAATALNVDVKTLTRGFDTVMFCLSKGLCAPVGSMLVGSRDAIDEARVYRKALGGGMRQAGILAAAGLIALNKMPARLHEDHANARMLASAIAQLPEVEIDLESVQTNIVIFELKTRKPVEVIASLKAKGVLISQVGPRAVRLVTHHDVDHVACEQAARVLVETL
ncbi:threonine aldolase family protein [Acidicapsa ligni]|uniref:threonine aldolase family protein n=1 Tax=Acidicapsa ligni TaxID=542300 RepID=UPI0021DF9388|nr:GntG family PLP-dependent aldolase [Acidicapsa ligni]